MFTRILSALAGRSGNKSVKHPDPDIRLFERSAQAYLQMRSPRNPPSADFGIDTTNIW
jgi:hypothetical protein